MVRRERPDHAIGWRSSWRRWTSSTISAAESAARHTPGCRYRRDAPLDDRRSIGASAPSPARCRRRLRPRVADAIPSSDHVRHARRWWGTSQLPDLRALEADRSTVADLRQPASVPPDIRRWAVSFRNTVGGHTLDPDRARAVGVGRLTMSHGLHAQSSSGRARSHLTSL